MFGNIRRVFKCVPKKCQSALFREVDANRRMERVEQSANILKQAYLAGVESVLPHALIPRFVRRDGNVLLIGDKAHKLNHNVHVIGFGKAVITMIKPLETLLANSDGSSHLVSGVVSVPYGITSNFHAPHLLPENCSRVSIMEGAKNNIPDEAAYAAALKIFRVIESLTADDLVLALISGGGSSLLPAPIPPLTIESKSEIVRSLGRAGANISELNTVRKVLSVAKGGKLVSKTKANIVSLIVSDFIDNLLDVIASGPTVPNNDPPGEAYEIIKKYKLTLPDNVLSILKDERNRTIQDFSRVTNVVIGDNTMALKAVKESIEEHLNSSCRRGEVVISSASLTGDCVEQGRNFSQLIQTLLHGFLNHKNFVLPHELLSSLCITDHQRFIAQITEAVEQKKEIFLLFGGETTVTVTGSGSGGRNQHLVLSVASFLNKIHGCGDLFSSELTDCTVVFMSAGTDGIDGPSPAAGAYTYWTSLRNQLSRTTLDVERHLANHDSYGFYKLLEDGKYLIIPGHTGTNVMDIQILYIYPPKSS